MSDIVIGIGRGVTAGGESDILGFDEISGTIGVVVAGCANEDFAVYEVVVHEFEFAHEFAGEVTRLVVKVHSSAEGDGTEVLGASFVIIPELVTSFIMDGVDIADATTKRRCTIVPDGETKHLGLGAVLISFVMVGPEVGATYTGGFGEGLMDEPLGDVEGGTRILDFVNDENMFTIESGWSLADGINIFAVDAALYIQGAKTSKIGGWDVGGLEVAESLASL